MFIRCLVVVSLCGLIAPALGQDIKTGLTHHWKFDEAGQQELAFDSAGTNHASLGGNQQGDQRWVPGLFGNAIEFFRPEHYAITSVPIPLETFTISWWSLQKDNTNLNPRIISMPIWVHTEENAGIGTQLVYSQNPPILFEWEHYAVTVDTVNNHVNVYKHGFLSATGPQNINGPSPDQWVLGHHGNLALQIATFLGVFDDFRVYDRILAPEDVFELYSMGADTIVAQEFDVISGFQYEGTLEDTFGSDDKYLKFRQAKSKTVDQPIQVTFESTLAIHDPNALCFSVESSSNINRLEQRIEFFNYELGGFDVVESGKLINGGCHKKCQSKRSRKIC